MDYLTESVKSLKLLFSHFRSFLYPLHSTQSFIWLLFIIYGILSRPHCDYTCLHPRHFVSSGLASLLTPFLYCILKMQDLMHIMIYILIPVEFLSNIGQIYMHTFKHLSKRHISTKYIYTLYQTLRKIKIQKKIFY